MSLSPSEKHTGRPPPAPDEGLPTVHRSSASTGEEENEDPVSAIDSARPQSSHAAFIDLPDNLLLEISAAFLNRSQCIRLAVALKIIEENEVLKLLSESTFNDRLAYTIMKKWVEVHDQQATGLALHAALCDIEQQGLADQFKEGLLGRDLSTIEKAGATAVALNVDPATSGVLGCHAADCCPDDALLKEIGKAISSHEQCMNLALKLKIGDDNLYKLDEAELTETLAYEVLTKWLLEKDRNATGAVLHAALCDAERRDLADRFEDWLFGRDVGMNLTVTEEIEDTVVALDADPDFSSTRTSNLVLPSVNLLTEISSYLPRLKHCIRLAEKLDLPEEFVKRLREGRLGGTAGRGVLFQWKQKESK